MSRALKPSPKRKQPACLYHQLSTGEPSVQEEVGKRAQEPPKTEGSPALSARVLGTRQRLHPERPARARRAAAASESRAVPPQSDLKWSKRECSELESPDSTPRPFRGVL